MKRDVASLHFQPYLNPQRFLVPPHQRAQFVALFVVASLIAASFGAMALRRADFLFLPALPPALPWRSQPVNWSALAFNSSLLNALLGLLMGAVQWLVLRPYMPNLSWILAVAIGLGIEQLLIALLNSLRDTVFAHVLDAASDLQYLSLVLIGTIVSVLGAILATLGVGVLQRLSLQKYVDSESAQWWIALYPVAKIASFFIVLLWTMGLVRVPMAWPVPPALIIWIVLQAIAFCGLRQKHVLFDEYLNPTLDTPLAHALEMQDPRRVRALTQQIYRQLNKQWNGHLSADSLNYLLGIDANGAIAVCIPADEESEYFISETPLPDLMSAKRPGKASPRLAKALVHFGKRGELRVRSYCGIALWRLGMVAIAATAGVLAGSTVLGLAVLGL